MSFLKKLFKKYYWAILPFLGWCAVFLGAGFNGVYGQDAYAYLLYSRELKDFIIDGTPYGYFFWPVNYPFLMALTAMILKSHFLAGQLISVLCLAGIGWFLNRLLRQVYGMRENITVSFVTLTILLSPYMFRLGNQVMSDMLAMFFLTGSFYHLLRAGRSINTRTALLWTLFTGLAVTTRYPAAIVLIGPSIYVGFLLIKTQKWQLLIMMMVVSVLVLFPAIWWRWDTIDQLVAEPHFDGLTDWSVANYFKTGFLRRDGQSHYLLPNLLFNISLFVHPGTVFFGTALLPFALPSVRKHTVLLITLFSVIIYWLFLSGIPFQNSRVMIFTYPLVAMLFAPAFRILAEKISLRGIRLSWLFILVVIIQVGLCARALAPSIKYQKMELELLEHIIKNHPNSTVYTFAYSQIFEVYETENPVVNTFNEELSKFENGSLYIFNEELVQSKLNGTVPHKNWLEANRQMELTVSHCWPNGWCVYTMQNK